MFCLFAVLSIYIVIFATIFAVSLRRYSDSSPWGAFFAGNTYLFEPQHVEACWGAFLCSGMIPKTYCHDICSRSFLRYWKGWGVRFLQNIEVLARSTNRSWQWCQDWWWSHFSVSLPRKMNANVVIGAHTSIETDSLDTRNPLLYWGACHLWV